MLPEQRNKLTMSILGKLKERGVPEMPSVAPMGDWDDEDQDISPTGTIVESKGDTLKKYKLLSKKNKKQEEPNQNQG